MKKIVAAIALCGAVLGFSGCKNTEREKKTTVPNIVSLLPDSSSDSGTSSSTQSESSAVSEPVISEPVFSEPASSVQSTSEPLDNSGEITDIHDLSKGNGIYNPNVTDTTYYSRYYGDFTRSDDPKALWISDIDEVPWESYDWEAAVEYGLAHWNDGVGLCAPFVSACLKRGDIINYTESSTSLALQLLHSRLGFGQFLAYNKSDHTVTLPEYARPGDVVQIYCNYEGCIIHSTLMVGTDEEGRLKAVAHNNTNSGQSAFIVDGANDPCCYCFSETAEVFFYHFYRDDDEGLPEEIVNNKNILLWEEKAYTIQGESYDREAALEYAQNNHKDGLGYYGAQHTSNILQAGGLTVGYPNQSALLLQLLKTHLGTAYSQRILDDRTVILPQNVKAGDIGFVYCPKDGTITSSFIISGSDNTGRMITLSYDLLNDGKSAFKIENRCVGCGEELNEVVIYCFDD